MVAQSDAHVERLKGIRLLSFAYALEFPPDEIAMRAQILGIGAIVTLALAPAVWAGPDRAWKSEEARLSARISEQRVRIQQLEAQLAALTPASARQPMPLRVGLTTRDLWVVRGKPDFVTRTGSSIEVWGYGSIRVTLMNGRV